MKTIPIERLDEHFTQAINQQSEHEVIGLTKDNDTVAWVVRAPKRLKDAEPDIIFSGEEPDGSVLVLVRTQRALPKRSERTPVFGAGRGTLTLVSEDDEHLTDFKDYIE